MWTLTPLEYDPHFIDPQMLSLIRTLTFHKYEPPPYEYEHSLSNTNIHSQMWTISQIQTLTPLEYNPHLIDP